MATGDQLLFLKLADAYARPSGAYRAASAALDVPNQGLEGYLQGTQAGDAIRKSKMGRRLLGDVLGQGLEGVSVNEAEALARPLSAYADYKRATGTSSSEDWLTKFNMQQNSISDRQKQRQDFAREMVGAKGNKEAVNQAKNASQGLGYLDNLWNAYDKLSGAQQAGAGTPIIEKFFPEVNAAKANVLRTAGFAEGGKNFTGTERGIIVDSFLPTTYETSQSKALKKRIGREYYLGTIDLYDAARLLGPAGAKLKAVADAQQAREKLGNSLVNQEAGINDETDPYSQVGL